jgi:trk system potassium uptake protein TrkH
LIAVLGFVSGSGVDIITMVTAVASSLGNVGPGLGEIGPTGSYLGLPAASKWLLSSLMIIGRLEILPILILLNPEVWRK